MSAHRALTVLAVAVAHIVSVVMRKRPPELRTYAPHVVATVIVLAIVSFGILAIRPSIFG